MGAIEHPPILTIPGVPDHVLYTWVAMLVLIVLSFAATRHLALVPRGAQNFMEMALEQFLAFLDDVIGHDGRRYLHLIATLGLFILTANLLGLFPGLMAPTGNLNTTVACALIVFVSHLARPLSLALRLFGNMAGGHILLAVMFLLTAGMIGWAFSGSLGAIGL